jgi:hypothetical protein
MKTQPRQTSRKTLNKLTYIELVPDNGGMVLNISEAGLCFYAAGPVQKNETIHFRLSEPEFQIEADGDLIWSDETQKTVGLRFTNLSAEDQRQLRNWISPPAVAFTAGREDTPPVSRGPLSVPQQRRFLAAAREASRSSAPNPGASFSAESQGTKRPENHPSPEHTFADEESEGEILRQLQSGHFDKASKAIWATGKYKKLRHHFRRAEQWLSRVSRRDPQLFARWQPAQASPRITENGRINTRVVHDSSTMAEMLSPKTREQSSLRSFSGGFATGVLVFGFFVGAGFLLSAHRRQLGEALIHWGEKLGAASQAQKVPAAEAPETQSQQPAMASAPPAAVSAPNPAGSRTRTRHRRAHLRSLRRMHNLRFPRMYQRTLLGVELRNPSRWSSESTLDMAPHCRT